MIKELYEKKIYKNIGNLEVIEQVPENAYSILDIGCGAGDNARLLKGLKKYVVGLTISDVEAKMASKICDKVIIANIEEDICLNEKFDVIILSHVCEHLVNPQDVLKKLVYNLTDIGIFIIAVPNMAYYKNRLRLLKGNWDLDETGPFDKTHLHFYSYDSVNSICLNELNIIRKIPGQLALPLWPFRRLFPFVCKKIDKKIGKFYPNLFAQQVILIINKN